MIKKLLTDKPKAGFRELLRWGWQAIRGSRRHVALVGAIGVVRVGISLSFVWVSKMLIDAATEASTPNSTIWLIAALLCGCMLTDLALTQLLNYLKSLYIQRMTNTMRQRIYSHVLHSDIYTDRRHSGDILSRITVDVGSVVGAAMNTIPDIAVMAVQLIGAFWLLCVMNPMLAVCALIISPICILASKAYMAKMRRINAEIRRGESEVNTSLQEGLQHRMVVQTLECAPEITSRLDKLQQNVFSNILWRTKVSLFSRTTVRLGFLAGYLIAFIWSVFGLHNGTITYGIMTAFLQLVGRIQGPISSLSNTIPSLVGTATAIDRLMEIYPLDPEQSKADRHAPKWDSLTSVGIKLSDITFAYPDSSRKIFEGYSHDFKPGSKTVIMGQTGVGKSTLTKLILALLHPQSGSIEVYGDGHTAAVSAATRSLMTYVPQGNSLLHGSIRDNLRLGNSQASEEQMRQALHIAVANFVYDLPEGLDTPCGELGGSLSEGQCQRIAIARALLRDCPVLILDEFNSSLDQATAETLLQRLMAARPDATIIFISHRPDVAAFCDSVLRLN